MTNKAKRLAIKVLESKKMIRKTMMVMTMPINVVWWCSMIKIGDRSEDFHEEDL